MERVEPISEAPAFLHLPLLAEATYFTGEVPSQGVRIKGVETLSFGAKPAEAIARHNAIGIEQCDSLDVPSFARMVAKIGYCFIAATFGLPPREEVTVLPLILGERDDGSHWVGSARFSTEADKQGALHSLSHTAFSKKEDPAHQVLVARVKLFAASGASGYEVIVHRSRTEL